MEVKLTEGSGKMILVNSLNSSPLDNEFCEQQSKDKDSICHLCYSRRMLSTYRKSCRDKFIRNGEVLSERILSKYEIPLINDSIFRFHSHGELINDNHLINFINITKKNHWCDFALWTKRHDIVKRIFGLYEKPKNMFLVFSSPINETTQPPKYFDKVYTNYTDDYIGRWKVRINCKLRCIECQLCYRENKVTNIKATVK